MKKKHVGLTLQTAAENVAIKGKKETHLWQHVLPRGAEYVAKLHAPVQTGVTKSEVPLPATLPYRPSGQSLHARAPGRLYEPLGHGPAHWREVALGWLP